jgi:hypothetical protein
VLANVTLPHGQDPAQRIGTGIGSRAIENSFNTKEPQHMPPAFDVGLLNSASIGGAVAGITWLAIGDEQAMIDCVSGLLLVHDCGDAFAGLSSTEPSRMRRPHASTIPAAAGCAARDIEGTLARIEALDDTQIAEFVAAVPPGLQAVGLDVRASIGQWMATSRDRLRAVLEAEWT